MRGDTCVRLSAVVRVALVLACVLTSGFARAEIVHIDPNAPPPTTLTANEEARLRTLQAVSYPWVASDVSPDDRRIFLYGSSGPVLFDLTNGQTSTLNPWTQPVNYISDFRWNDVKTLAALAVAWDWSAFYRVLIADTGEATLQPLDTGGNYPFSLSPRGNRVMYARVVESTDPLLMDVMVLDVPTGRQWTLVRIPQSNNVVADWTPSEDGVAIVRSQFPSPLHAGVAPNSAEVLDSLGRLAPEVDPLFTSNRLDVFDLSGPELRHREIRSGPAGGDVFLAPHWSSDGRMLVATMGVPSHPAGHRYPTAWKPKASRYRFYSPNGRWLGTLDRPEIAAPWGNGVFFLSPEDMVIATPVGTDSALFHYDLRTGRLRRLSMPEGTIGTVRPTHRTRRLVYNHGSIQTMPEMYSLGLDGRAPRTLTQLNAWAAGANQVRVDHVSFDLGASGRREGLLVQPAGASFPPHDVPLVVWQGGGPNYSMTNQWSALAEGPFNLLPNFGYAVLIVPLEGRLGFGAERMDALADGRNFGQVDVDEQARIVRQLVQRGWVRSRGVGIAGCSYGGFFTSQSIVRHPDLYAAANPQCALVDQVNEWQNGFTAETAFFEGRTPSEDYAEYVRDSPMRNASAVRTPTLLFSGSYDFLGWETSAQFHDGIEAAGTPARMLVFDGDGHNLGWQSWFTAAETQLLWFRQYLGLP